MFTYTSGSGFAVNAGSTFIDSYTLSPVTVSFPATLTFTGLSDVGNVVNLGGSEYGQTLSGGTFLMTDSSGTLLSGTFSEALLTGTIGNNQGSVKTQFEDVVYDSTPYFVKSGLSDPGGLSFDLTSVTPSFGLTPAGTKFESFGAAGSGTFSATPATTVPEPGTTVPFVLGGLALLGLIVGKTRRTSRHTGGATA